MPSRSTCGRRVEDSLRRLGTDRIDLYQLHRPDPEVPIEDTLGALDELVRAGKVREIGCSNFSAEQLARGGERQRRDGGARFVSVQNEYSLLHREPERDVLAECERQGLAFLPYFPLASGLLTGKYRQGQPAPEGSRLQSGRGDSLLTERNLAVVEELIEFCRVAGAHDTGARLLLAAHTAGRSVGDRRRYVAGAGTEQRGSRRLAADRYGARRDRLDRVASALKVPDQFYSMDYK